MNRLAVLLVSVAASISVSAQAAVVTFDDAVGEAQTGGYQAGESFSDQGLTFTYSPAGSAFMELWDASGLGAAAGSNGTNTLLVGAGSTDYVTITRTGGGQFSLLSLLLGINEAQTPEISDSVLINGVTQSITNTATSYSTNLNGVTSVTISGLAAGGYVSVNNVTYQVPEPASIAVLGVGIAGLALIRRRRGTPARM